MAPALILLCLWVVLAAALSLLPGRFHWRVAWLLIALGIPLAGYATLKGGPLLGLLALAVGLAVLRWPARRGMRFVLRGLGLEPPAPPPPATGKDG
ncbi:MAG: DUF2484 family protein [Rhodobacteraceae bacterium]|nr:DUF2484 family protein [Paracoccaceae bacterium]